ncbi:MULTISPECIES: hypothetical protein [Pseudomonas]|uniref:hypothetical protein n=1 Tax=Pseudomonas TaxID=286 RepID=UPI000A9B89F9|nr:MULTISPECIES: hypothetical protein [Pseudomonas]MBB4055360.1 hypothetical protein [Pseudomonas koreensis]TSB51793.1 hypothetical protein FEE99_13235 [Pseudomonas sp. ef1]
MSEDKGVEGKRHQISTLTDFRVVDVGDFIADDKVLRIFSRTSKHLIYEKHSGVSYGAIDTTTQQSADIGHLDQLLIQAKRKLKGVHHEALQSYKSSILTAIFCADEGVTKKAIENLENFIRESPSVKNVVECRDNYIVWISELGIEHWIKRTSEVNAGVLSQFYNIKSLGLVVVPKSKLKKFYGKLASCLVVGLSKGIDCEEDVFEPVKKYIDKCVVDAARFKLVVVVFLISICVLFLAAGARLYFFGVSGINFQALLIGIFGGALGAMISVLQRAKGLKVELYESIELILLQGGVRISLGCAFGVIALVASKSGLLLELLSQSANKMFLLSVVAGFSERLIPDFIGKIADDGVK